MTNAIKAIENIAIARYGNTDKAAAFVDGWQAALVHKDCECHDQRDCTGACCVSKQQGGQQPVAWPQTPEQISDFIGSNFVWREGNDVAPKDGDKYCVTAHDLLSAFREWPEFAAAPVQPECDAARVLEWMRTPNRKPAQLAFTEGLERQAAYWVEIAQGEPLRAQPLTCDTCKFSEADKDNPAIRIYEETCFWCSQYYANHYEAHGIGVQK